jgi:hypothetical protein
MNMKNAARATLLVAGALALGATFAGCLAAPEDRAARDEMVGQGYLDGTSFRIVDGLGAVRSIGPETATLRAQAPTIDIRVSRNGDTTTSWMITIDNVLPDATLEVRRPDGTSVVMPDRLPGAFPTQGRWAAPLPPGESILALRPLGDASLAPWRFGVLSDIQEAIDGVQDIYRRMNTDPTLSFIVSTGDLTRRGSREELDRFERELESLNVPFYPTMGNHELGTEDGAVFQRTYGRGNFRFVYAGMQFTFLDSASATLDPRVYDWLDVWLAEGRDRTHAVIMHIPPLDPTGVRNGAFANRNEAAKLLTLLADANVDLTLYGHIHSYYAFSNANIPAYISGGGGSIPERFDGIGRHYLTVDVDPQRGILSTGIVRIDLD